MTSELFAANNYLMSLLSASSKNARPLQLSSSKARDLETGEEIYDAELGFLRYYIDQRSFRFVFRYAKYDNGDAGVSFPPGLGLIPFRVSALNVHMTCGWDQSWDIALQRCVSFESAGILFGRRLLNEDSETAMPVSTWENDTVSESVVPCTLSVGCIDILTNETGGQVYVAFGGNLSQCGQNNASYCETAVKVRFDTVGGVCPANSVEISDAEVKCQCQAGYRYDEGAQVCLPCGDGEYAFAFDADLVSGNYTLGSDTCVACVQPQCHEGFYVHFPVMHGVATCERDSTLEGAYDFEDAVRCEACASCPVGEYRDGCGGGASSGTCITCPAGIFFFLAAFAFTIFLHTLTREFLHRVVQGRNR